MKFFDRLLTIIITATLTSAFWIVFGNTIFELAADESAEALVLDRAEIDDQGWISASYHARDISHEVRSGDVLHQGVAFHGSLQTGEFEVRPRIWRMVCTNGTLVELEEVAAA